MNQQEAEALCAKYAAEHPDRETHSWIARPTGDGEFAVIKIGLPPIEKLNLKTNAGEEDAPQTGDDPRPSLFQNVPPFGA